MKLNTQVIIYLERVNGHLHKIIDSTPGEPFVIENKRYSIFNLPNISKGNQPTDGGGLLLNEDEYTSTLKLYPELKKYILKFIGANEFINGIRRYTLWINDSDFEKINRNEFIVKRMDTVRKSRLSSKKKSTKLLADIPYKYGEIRREESDFTILIPAITSGNRLYVPMILLFLILLKQFITRLYGY